jgi:hypothetical protein
METDFRQTFSRNVVEVIFARFSRPISCLNKLGQDSLPAISQSKEAPIGSSRLLIPLTVGSSSVQKKYGRRSPCRQGAFLLQTLVIIIITVIMMIIISFSENPSGRKDDTLTESRPSLHQQGSPGRHSSSSCTDDCNLQNPFRRCLSLADQSYLISSHVSRSGRKGTKR